ncbi:hypothetical protein LVJ94_22095 [Pendulispora rubella]|uniref:Dickkopf N-terminal cysteine-rich domain-containing protein n=1 Tax=Pendulispora rubella TaxID=2741070 RepID=A0ABZ2LG53_9BACT
MASCSESKFSGEGSDCLQATDCEPGLACVPLNDGRRVCKSDLSGAQPRPENDSGRRDGNAGDASRDADAAVRDVNRPDTNVPDTNVPDTQPPIDSGADTASDM